MSQTCCVSCHIPVILFEAYVRLGRLFRLLAAFYVVEEAGVDTFKPTPFSYAIGDESTKVRASLEAA